MHKKITRRQVENWLLKNGHLINKTAFEREIGISKGVLQKFLRYEKRISDSNIKELFKLIKQVKRI